MPIFHFLIHLGERVYRKTKANIQISLTCLSTYETSVQPHFSDQKSGTQNYESLYTLSKQIPNSSYTEKVR